MSSSPPDIAPDTLAAAAPADPPEIRVVGDAAELTRAAAEEVTAALSSLPAPPSILLSGGSTPRALFQLLADPASPYRARIAWEAVRFFWGDERHVPPDHPDSNFRMAREAMLDHVPVPAAHVHRIAGEEPDASRAAALYEHDLIASFHLQPDRGNVAASYAPTAPIVPAVAAPSADPAIAAALDRPADWPRFNVVLLGLGEEGHTASLFPGSPVLGEERRLVAAPWVEAHQTYRITVTPPVINHAARVIFLVSGASKAPAVAAILAGRHQPSLYPAEVVAPGKGRLLWLLDRAAASQLQKL
jgi:6-phosphogluconolactonase